MLMEIIILKLNNNKCFIYGRIEGMFCFILVCFFLYRIVCYLVFLGIKLIFRFLVIR